MANKTKMRPANNKRARDSFEKRYGMTRSQWAEKKKTMTGKEIEETRQKAYVQFIKKA